MSNVSGSISVNVEFRDSTTSSGVQSLKTIALRETTEYTTGKVAIITGTAGTNQFSVNTYSTSYRDSSGSLVTFSALSRVVFSYSGSTARKLNDADSNFLLSSRNNEPAASSVTGNVDAFIDPGTGTGTYTIVLYGT